MKCLIDGRVLTHEKVTGVERYTVDVIDALKKFNDFEWKVAKPKNSNRFYHVFWEQFILPKICRKEKTDILFCPANVAPIGFKLKKIKVVTVIHDIHWKLLPDSISWKFRKYYSFIIPRVIRHSDAIITISNFAKGSIVKYFPKFKNKIYVIYESFDKSTFRTFALPRKKQILYVGSLAKHKNFIGIIKAFYKIYQKIPG